MKQLTTTVVLLLCTITVSAQLFVLKEADGEISYIHLSNNALVSTSTTNCIEFAEHDFLYNSDYSNRMNMSVYSCDNPRWSRTNFRAFSYDMKVIKFFSVLYSGQEVDYRTFNLSSGNTYVQSTSTPKNSSSSSSSSSSSFTPVYVPEVTPSAPSNEPASNPYKGHYETKTERCVECMGRGYNMKYLYHGGSNSSSIQQRCSFCHGKGTITKREYVLDN